ncbi:magnesium transporter CorA family protein [Petroclostridium sp. X23]|jgi:magnesium transporter|uniref:magnesium transporter CorA family protein n=1 Tax=Petroclostridium sp. X23 TaxID=3045146 RepID=UPI0024AD7E8D|nr:magnesium transporter CorA family protein [Petroclostridium sp. X23]WHH61431.1 magnesium transporter CorA family protein [Petroclostridium sp. X23]
MLGYYKTIEGRIQPIDRIEEGCWINMICPNEEEIESVLRTLHVDAGFLKAALDDEETSRIEIEDNQTLIIIDIPLAQKDQDAIIFSTIPLGIVITDKNIITICLKENSVIREFSDGVAKNVYTNLKTRFILQLFFKVATRYLQYLKQIDKISNEVEKQLHRSMKNKELIQLLDLEKSLVYFSTSLKANEITMEKILRGRTIKLYEEDQDLLEDVLIENKQAIEMSNIYSSILSGTMDAFASVISNNLNIVMKFLTSVTIVLSLPTMVASFYGMNVELPLQDSPLAFIFTIILALILTIAATLVLLKRKMF